MSHGLRVWNSAGNVIFDPGDRMGRFHTSIYIGSISPRASAVFSVPGFSTDGTWFMVVQGAIPQYIGLYEGSGSISAFNSDYIYARGGFTVYIFRG